MAWDVLKKLLQVEAPWTIKEVKVDAAGKRMEIAVGVEEPRSWFGPARKRGDSGHQHVWRHLNLGPYHCHVRVFLPAGARTVNQPWAGEANAAFSHALARTIVGWLGEGIDLKRVGTVLDIEFQELWKFKFALDTGHMVIEEPQAAADAAGLAEATSEAVPDLTDPVWQELAEGRLNIDIRVLSLKLILTRVKSQLEMIQDREVKLLKLRELHRYFVRNERVLGHELAQLRRAR